MNAVDWRDGVVAVLGRDGQPAGAAFLLAVEGKLRRRLLVTCHHVLLDAGWSEATPEAPVQIRFQALPRRKGAFARARVRREQFEAAKLRDVAFLLLPAPAPVGVAALPLAGTENTEEHVVHSLGFPRQRAWGAAGEGKILFAVQDREQELLQFNSTDMTEGFSGAPLWDRQLQRVVGMVKEGEEEDGKGRRAFVTYAVTSETLLALHEGLSLAPPWRPPQPLPEEIKPYLRAVAREAERVPLLALDQGAGGAGEGRVLLESVYVGLSVGTIHREKRPNGMIRRDPGALGVISRQQNVILLGDPGSGKTTLLKHVALELARAAEAEAPVALSWEVFDAEPASKSPDEEPPVSEEVGDHQDRLDELPGVAQRQMWMLGHLVPLYLVLGDFARTSFDSRSPEALWEYAAAGLAPELGQTTIQALRDLAVAGRVLFLLDGVDEVPQRDRAAVWDAVDALRSGLFSACRWVATCRILSFDADEAPDAVVETLHPFTTRQVEHFIDRWYGAYWRARLITRAEAATFNRRLRQALERPALLELARNPMLLTVMAIVQIHYGTLPGERVRLYQSCVEILLYRRQRHIEQESDAELPATLSQLGLEKDELEQLLAAIAWEAHSRAPERRQRVDIPQSTVLRIAGQFLKTLQQQAQFLEYTERRAHLLVARGGIGEPVYAFPHRTFQEYLAACHIANMRDLPHWAPELAARDAAYRELLNLAAGTLVHNRDGWLVVLLAAERMVPDGVPADDDEAGWRRIWMAGEMAAVVGLRRIRRDKYYRENLLPVLRRRLAALVDTGRLPPAQRAEAGIALAALGDPRPGVGIVQRDGMRIPDIALCYVPSGPFLMGSLRDDPFARDNEKPQFELDVPYGYWIGQFPVTAAQWRAFLEQTDGDPRERDQEEVANHPARRISWRDAMAFCQWMTGVGRRLGWLPEEWLVTLPSEAEWEKAARGGLMMPAPDDRIQIRFGQGSLFPESRPQRRNPNPGRRYPWGDEMGDGQANVREKGVGTTCSVGMYPRDCSEYGVRELSGNLNEWTRTPHRAPRYPLKIGDDEAEEEPDSGRVLRGGSYRDEAGGWPRCSGRYWDVPYLGHASAGFRVVIIPIR